ncbi:protein transport protein HofC [Citrobacter freundii]|uniref:protein transport protein HofC n=1 Tax=Citrobacter TaxID=544 RepID=UPI000C7FA9ED|nr:MULTISPECIES: protein transport protein HofC [Citrobacter]MBJ9855756.1 protein transport protein HofC [Citrobacter freundii]MDM3242358.1 protein transport protein HofC [Citrobacter sp. Cf081]MDR4049311.1 protein transport protein HofC [Citrobacter sp.]PMD02710.1 type IV pilin biogenesis protein [Citrobacter freundii]WLV33786.1 protein transport protein HofC [Citrobacter freundii]
MSTKQLWRWQGINNKGTSLEGMLWADTRPSLMLALEKQQITPLRIKRMRVKTSHWSRTRSAETIHQLAILLKAGLTLSAGLALLAEQHSSSQWQALLRTLAYDMEQGITLSTSLSQWQHVFPPLYQAMIRTGELTGKLDDCCFELAYQQKKQQQLADKVKKALRYPIIIITMAVLVVFAMLQFVLPEFAAIYQTFNTPLPALTQWIITIAHYSSQWGWLAVALGLVAVAAHHLINQKPYWLVLRQKLLLSLPVIGPMVRGQKLTQIFTVLALTQNAGIPFLQGLESVTETLANPFWSQRLALVQHDISAGKPVWLALKNSGEFSPLCIQLVRTGEASGSLDAMLRNLAHHHGEKTLAQAENLAALLEPALLVITGLIIGTLVVAMYLPIFHLGDAMSGVG